MRPPVPPRRPGRVVDPARTLRPVDGPSLPEGDDRARFAVARENRQAATRLDLDPTDPRWVLAVRTASQMEGGVLTPERRERVMRTAERLGIRPFDASVVIAMVQDRLRRGGHLAEVAPELGLIATPVTRARRRRLPGWARFLLALAVATAVNLLLVRWLLGGP